MYIYIYIHMSYSIWYAYKYTYIYIYIYIYVCIHYILFWDLAQRDAGLQVVGQVVALNLCGPSISTVISSIVIVIVTIIISSNSSSSSSSSMFSSSNYHGRLPISVGVKELGRLSLGRHDPAFLKQDE